MLLTTDYSVIEDCELSCTQQSTKLDERKLRKQSSEVVFPLGLEQNNSRSVLRLVLYFQTQVVCSSTLYALFDEFCLFSFFVNFLFSSSIIAFCYLSVNDYFACAEIDQIVINY